MKKYFSLLLLATIAPCSMQADTPTQENDPLAEKAPQVTKKYSVGAMVGGVAGVTVSGFALAVGGVGLTLYLKDKKKFQHVIGVWKEKQGFKNQRLSYSSGGYNEDDMNEFGTYNNEMGGNMYINDDNNDEIDGNMYINDDNQLETKEKEIDGINKEDKILSNTGVVTEDDIVVLSD